MDLNEAREFIREHHRAVLATRRRGGSPQMSIVVCGVDNGGSIVISSRETAMKTKNLARDPHASICVFSDGFFGPWVQVDGTATVVSLPDAMDPLIDYYRSLSGEHPNWEEYRAAMESEKRVIIRIQPERAGPDASG
ncbi:MAG: PPOX class F420-dependent oxidoreductase [Acidimicrobiia bacterium]